MNRVVVAGGGIAGLTAAFTLRREAARRGVPLDLVVVEAGDEPGGHARTIDEGGFLIERGPNGFLDRGVETMTLIEEAGLTQRLVEANTAAQRRFILKDGKLRQVPESPPALLASDALSWRAKLRLMREPWAAPPPENADETVFAFAERRLGREAAETFVDTAVAGISAGDSRALSVRSQFPILKEFERQHGSLLKALLRRKSAGRPKLMSFDRGIGTLTTAIASQLGGSLRLGCRIDRIERTERAWRVSVQGGQTLDADRVICALPSHAAARVVKFDRDLAAALAAIPYCDVSVVALAYRGAAVSRELDGYGYLVTKGEDQSTLGVLWESSIFPDRVPDGYVLLRVILGGARRPEVSAFDDASVAELAAAETSRVLGISGHPARRWLCRWPSAIAQYTVGHDARLSAVNHGSAPHSGLHLCGTAYEGVSFNDAIASARRTARAVAQELAAPSSDGGHA